MSWTTVSRSEELIRVCRPAPRDQTNFQANRMDSDASSCTGMLSRRVTGKNGRVYFFYAVGKLSWLLSVDKTISKEARIFTESRVHLCNKFGSDRLIRFVLDHRRSWPSLTILLRSLTGSCTCWKKRRMLKLSKTSSSFQTAVPGYWNKRGLLC